MANETSLDISIGQIEQENGFIDVLNDPKYIRRLYPFSDYQPRLQVSQAKLLKNVAFYTRGPSDLEENCRARKASVMEDLLKDISLSNNGVAEVNAVNRKDFGRVLLRWLHVFYGLLL